MLLEGWAERVPLNFALMEAEYTANYSSAGSQVAGEGSDDVAVSMTATRDAQGRLLIGALPLHAF